MQFWNGFRPFAIFIVAAAALGSGAASAKDIYIAQNAAGAADGSNCDAARAYGFFNSSSNWGTGITQIGPGTTVHICGTITGASNSTLLSFQGSGAAGSPITLLFEPGAVLQAPYFASSLGGVSAGAITMGTGRSYLVVDGGSNGIIRNTANGSGWANQQASTGVSAFGCGNCVVRNLSIADIFVNVSGNGALGDNSVVRAMDISGSHWEINNNVMHDCGWCLINFYAAGDTDVKIHDNEFYNFGHAYALATGSAVSGTNFQFYNNRMHDTSNWDAPGCPFHQDGMHMFGVPGSSMSGLYTYNNYFSGDWGTCPTGLVFVEGGASTNNANLSNSYWWNNVAVISSPVANTNGWFSVFSGVSGVTQIFNNTIIGPRATDNSACFNIGPVRNLTFENNLITNCGNPVGIGGPSSIASVDYNLYGTSCQNGNNCFVWNGSFTGSFSNWKNACPGCDVHSKQTNDPGVSADASLSSSGSAAVAGGLNLASLATGAISSLLSDTTKGGTRTPLLRPGGSAWDIGAFQFSAASGGVTPLAPYPPTNVTATAR